MEDLSIDESMYKMSKAKEPEQIEEYVNSQGVRFIPLQQRAPYGALCVRELFRFLISLCSPLDKQNNEIMTHLGLSLLQVALEIAADALSNFSSLLALAKDDLCRNLILVNDIIKYQLYFMAYIKNNAKNIVIPCIYVLAAWNRQIIDSCCKSSSIISTV